MDKVQTTAVIVLAATAAARIIMFDARGKTTQAIIIGDCLYYFCMAWLTRILCRFWLEVAGYLAAYIWACPAYRRGSLGWRKHQ